MAKNLLTILVFVLLYNLFFYHVQLGIGMGILVFGLNLFYYLSRNPKSQNTKLALTFSSLASLFGFFFGWRDSGVVQTANFLTASFFSILAFYFYRTESKFHYKIKQTLLAPIYSTIDSLTSAAKLLSPKEFNSDNLKSDHFSGISKGLLIAIPLMTVLFFLLINADPVFGKLVDLLFKDIKERLVISGLIFIYLLVVSKTQIQRIFTVSEKIPTLNLGKFYELIIILCGVTFLFAGFIKDFLNC